MHKIKLTYRKATQTDIDYLLRLRKQTMNEHLINSGMDVSEENHLKRIMYQFDNAKIIYLNAKKIGLLKVSESQNKIEIIQFQIDPKYQQKGIGQIIIKSIIKKSSKKKLPVILSVLKVNKAKRLYERIGFNIIEENENSFIMKKGF